MEPTVGRKVWYRPGTNGADVHMSTIAGQPLDATVVGVHSANSINVVVFDAIGGMHRRLDVALLEPGVPPTGDQQFSGYCEWMPYQIGQAGKTAEIQAKLDEQPQGME